MADPYRFSQQAAGGFFYPQQGSQPQHPRHQIIRNNTPPNNTRSPFANDTPSPSRSPDSHSPAHNPYAMYQGHQQGQHGRANGGGGRGMQQHLNMYNNYQQTNTHQQQHPQQHSSIQQTTPNVPTSNGGILGHHTNYPSSLNSTTPNFVPAATMRHGTATQGGEMVAVSRHWEQIGEYHKTTEEAHQAALGGNTHYWARTKSGDNRQPAAAAASADDPNAPKVEIHNNTRISNEIDPTLTRQDWNGVDLTGQNLRIISKALFDFKFLGTVYLGSNKLRALPSWFGELRNLYHLDVSHNELTQLPPELGMCVFLKTLLAFNNKLATIPLELGSLYKLEYLGLNENEAAKDLIEEIMQNGTKSVIKRLLESAPVPLPPQPRQILDIADPSSPNPHDSFKVFTYNILCDNATREQYNYTPSRALEWSFRRDVILQEIENADADIVCMQEVDVDSFHEFFSVKLAYRDYKGAFWPKARAKTMSVQDAKLVDGCATFYKQSKYILLDKFLIDFQSIAINRPDMKGQPDVFNRVMPKDQMAVLTFFENRITGSRLIVANGHLYWDPAFPDVKLVQTAILMDQVNKQAEKYARWPACKDKKIYKLSEELDGAPPSPPLEPAPSQEYSSPTQLPLLLCVDLNSTAGSSVYELLSTGHVPADHRDLKGHTYGNITRDGIEHPFSLRSAYSLLDDGPDALTFTNYVPGFKGVIDHVFFSTNALEVITLLGKVDDEYMKRVPGFPNYHFPSDHLSLLIEFSVKGRKEKKSLPEPEFGTSSRRDRRD